MINSDALIYTSLLFIAPQTSYYVIYEKWPLPRYITALVFVSCFISVLFWSNPVKDSEIHALDVYFACISIVVVCAYACVYKHMNIPFLISFLLMLYFFYTSNMKSSIEWCCDEHIYYHVISHMFVFFNMGLLIYEL